MKWTKISGTPNDVEGFSTLDLPWLGALGYDRDSMVLSLRYLGGTEPKIETWSEKDSKGDPLSVRFAGAPYRIVEVRLPTRLAQERGTTNALNETVQRFFAKKGISDQAQVEWERIVKSATEQVSEAAAA